MSEGETAWTSAPLRLPWLASLAGWLTATALGWLVLLIFIEWDNARLDEGHVFEAEGAVRPPALFTPDWLENAALAYAKLLLVALLYAIPLMFLIARLEGRSERSAIGWYLAGAVAALPLAATSLLLVALSPSITWTDHLVPPLLLALLGTAGGGAARLVRHRRS